MKTGRLHLRVDEALLKKVRRIAKKNETNLTSLVTSYFRELVRAEQQAEKAIPEAEQI